MNYRVTVNPTRESEYQLNICISTLSNYFCILSSLTTTQPKRCPVYHHVLARVLPRITWHHPRLLFQFQFQGKTHHHRALIQTVNCCKNCTVVMLNNLHDDEVSCQKNNAHFFFTGCVGRLHESAWKINRLAEQRIASHRKACGFFASSSGTLVCTLPSLVLFPPS